MTAKRLFSAAVSVALASALSLMGCSSSDSSSDSRETTESLATAAPSLTMPAEPTETQTAAESSDETAASSEEETPPTEQGITPLMWELTTDSGSKVIFMGSMHALKDEIYPLPDSIMDAYNSSDVLAVECDVIAAADDFSLAMKQMKEMYYDDGSAFWDHLSPDVAEGFSAYAESCGYDVNNYRPCKLWVISSLAEDIAMRQTELSSDLGIDKNLLSMAHDDGKEIFEIESAEFQTDLLMNLPEDVLEMVIASYTVENKEAITQSLEDTYTAWKTGDLQFFEDSNDVEKRAELQAEQGITVTDEEKALFEEYNRIMLYERNEGMKEKAEELINSGKNVFFVVGAAHFPGEKGLLSLLEKDGYELTQINPAM